MKGKFFLSILISVGASFVVLFSVVFFTGYEKADAQTVCVPNIVTANGCNWNGWKYSGWVTTAAGINCNSGNNICSWSVRTGLLCSSNQITNVTMESHRTVGRGSCFTAGTQVVMADGSKKNIEDIKIGEQVIGASGPNTVMAFDWPIMEPHEDQSLMSINGMEFFITDNHPVMTAEGWKALNAKNAETEAYDILQGNISKLMLLWGMKKRLLLGPLTSVSRMRM